MTSIPEEVLMFRGMAGAAAAWHSDWI